MNPEDMTTAQWANLISVKIKNRQMRDARESFDNAIYEHCSAIALFSDIADEVGQETALHFAGFIIDTE